MSEGEDRFLVIVLIVPDEIVLTIVEFKVFEVVRRRSGKVVNVLKLAYKLHF